MKRTHRRRFLTEASAGSVFAALGALAGRIDQVAAAQAPRQGGDAELARRRSFSFLHTYEATGRYWRGLEKAGLIRHSTGVRLVNSPWGDDASRFNHVARLGGPLHQIIRQRRRPFIVDRICGGSPYHAYVFDAALVEAYVSLLGDNFLGGQLHEAVCNVANDWGRFLGVDSKYRHAPVDAARLRAHFDWGDSGRWLEYGTLDDYDGLVFPNSIDAFWAETMRSAKRQAARFQTRYSYCEGSHHGELSWPSFYKQGAGWCLAEVGAAASRRTQFMIASLRGAAKAAGRPWGVFFAPWGPGPRGTGCTCFVGAADISWKALLAELRKSGYSVGPEEGSSSALQRRAFFHAYLAGAHTLHEEWGAECNLTDWDRGAVSSYGQATREFLDFQEAFPDVGAPYTPIALVLDAAAPPPAAFDAAAQGGVTHRFFESRPIDAAWAQLKHKIFQTGAPAAGLAAAEIAKDLPAWARPEAACYAPSALPDIFDIVPSDAADAVWSTYRKVLAVGQPESPSCAERYPAHVQFDRFAEAVERLSPVSRSGVLPMQINFREADGAWLFALYNPFGARRGDVQGVGSVLDHRCTATEQMRPRFAWKSARAIYAWPENSTLSVDGKELQAVVGPGGVLIVEVT